MPTAKRVYVKPAVTMKGSVPEPVEAGCCLRSCGGKPAIMELRQRENAEVRSLIKRARGDLRSNR